MQAPHPPQNKIAQKNKVWAKKALKNNWAINGFFWGAVGNFWAACIIM
jgi:hypothetical protein